MIKDKPLVSVIIPCYNCEKFVEKAVMSIINQTYENLEIIIVDDCSTDGTDRILENISKHDNRIKYIKHKQNMKLIATLNEMIKLASGDYIGRMDADDISEPFRIEKQIDFMKKHVDCSICGTMVRIIDERDKVVSSKILPTSYEDIYKLMPFGNVIVHPSILANAEILKKYRYSLDYEHAEDFELWCRLIYSEKKKIYNLDETLLNYRISKNQVSNICSDEQVKSACKALQEYGLIEESDIRLHKEIFFYNGNDECFDKIEIESYIDKLIRILRKNKISSNRYKHILILDILRFLKRNNKVGLLFKYSLNIEAVKAILYYLLSLIRVKRG